MKAGGRGQLTGPTAPLRPKLLMTCCHRSALHHSHQTRPDCLRWQRDAGQAEKRGREKPLCVARVRHAVSEPMWACSQPCAEILCPTVYSSQVPFLQRAGFRDHWETKSSSSLKEKSSEIIWRNSRLYSQMLCPFWRALAGFVTIGHQLVRF